MRPPPLAPRHCPLPPLLPPSHPCPSLRVPEPRNRPRALRSRWLSKGNPDPDGFHLKIVAAVARVYMHESKMNRSPLTAAFAAKGLGAPDFALFCALPTPCSHRPALGAVCARRCAHIWIRLPRAQGTLRRSSRSRARSRSRSSSFAAEPSRSRALPLMSLSFSSPEALSANRAPNPLTDCRTLLPTRDGLAPVVTSMLGPVLPLISFSFSGSLLVLANDFPLPILGERAFS